MFLVYREAVSFVDKKLFGRFNIIDIILFSIIILAIIGAMIRILWNSATGERDAEITATCVSENFHGEALKYFEYEAELINEADESIIGRVESFNVSENGRLSVTVFSDGSKLEHGVSLDGTTYYVGSEVNIIIGDAVFEAYVSNIDASV